jgi:hypothetical protein
VIKAFWSPFVNAGEPVLFCIADQNGYSTIKLRDAADPQHETLLTDSLVTVIIDDVSPPINIAGLLRIYGKTYRYYPRPPAALPNFAAVLPFSLARLTTAGHCVSPPLCVSILPTIPT